MMTCIYSIHYSSFRCRPRCCFRMDEPLTSICIFLPLQKVPPPPARTARHKTSFLGTAACTHSATTAMGLHTQSTRAPARVYAYYSLAAPLAASGAFLILLVPFMPVIFPTAEERAISSEAVPGGAGAAAALILFANSGFEFMSPSFAGSKPPAVSSGFAPTREADAADAAAMRALSGFAADNASTGPAAAAGEAAWPAAVGDLSVRATPRTDTSLRGESGLPCCSSAPMDLTSGAP
jgi:hypothetical protein